MKSLILGVGLLLTFQAATAQAATDATNCRELAAMLSPGARVVSIAPAPLQMVQSIGQRVDWVWYYISLRPAGAAPTPFLCARNGYGEYLFINMTTQDVQILR